MKLSDKLIALRKNAGMSQEELAEKLDVSRQAISRWENGSAKPDADHLLQISKLFEVTADYLLNEAYESDNDLPKVKEQNHILHSNLTLIAIIAQASFLNAAIKPFEPSGIMNGTELVIKLVPLLLCSVWMAYNLRYEKDVVQYKKNSKIELLYCMIQLSIAMFGYYTEQYILAAILLFAVVMVYIFYINPKYMNRQLTKKRIPKD
ncbi:MAG: helix-turn-helix transcriptional regulator [Peptococcaceae bacterium]|nr:helix-turn-helix transcriptional regulator [Peptococcaceae bacterium]MBP3625182.1 helix-turn-helix transcriptional regulator [Peptococcaceae bacterium]